jgi:hypothetical protein
MTLINVYISEQAFCTFENPDHIDFGQFWYAEVPVPQLLVASQVCFK